MSFPDRESSALDGDEASDEQRLRLVRGHRASPDERRPAHVRSQALAQAQLQTQLLAQLQAQLQAHIPSNLVNYGSLTFLSNPVQYISELAHGFQGDIAMCKSFSLEHLKLRGESSPIRKRSSTSSLCTPPLHDSPIQELTGETSLAANGTLAHKQQQALMNGANPEQESLSPFESPTSKPSIPEAPDWFIKQPPAWFREGRCFSIWAPSEAEIHEGKFILLDSFNKEGRGVRVEVLGNVELRQIAESTTSYHNRVLLKACSHGSQRPSSSRSTAGYLQQPNIEQDPELLRAVDEKFLHASMDEHSQMDVHPGTIINLFTSYNIPFKYKCVDHGMLDDESFDKLRFHYIVNLVKAWRLTRVAKQHVWR